MYISSESLIVILFVGLIAGWLAGKVVRGAGFGIIGDIVIGIIGAFIASWLFPRLGIHIGGGLISEIISWKLRLFIPTSGQGSAILASLLERHTPVSVSDRAAAA